MKSLQPRWYAVGAAVVTGAIVSLGLTQVADSAQPVASESPSTSNPSPPRIVKKPVPKPVVNAATGPSPWRGARLRHPNGEGGFSPKVSRWANVVVAAMDDQDIPRKYLPGILAQIDQESDGDPNLVNTYDSNAAAGTPSKGLLQVIGPTFLSHAPVKYRNLKYQTSPYVNVWAALRYVKKRYGMDKFEAWNAGSNEAY